MKIIQRGINSNTKQILKRLDEDRHAELIIAVIQSVILLFYVGLFFVAPKASDNTTDFQPVLVVLGVAIPISAIRLYFAFKRMLHGSKVYLFILFDIFFLTSLIYSFHLQYQQPPGFMLKAPTFVHYFVFIALRCFQYNVRYLVFTGICSTASWVILISYAVNNDTSAVTRSYVDYVGSSKILIGAEIEKLLVMSIITLILVCSAMRFSKRFSDEFNRLEEAHKIIEQERSERIKAEKIKLELEEQKVKFLTIASHELRTPMNGLLGSLDLLEDKQDHVSTASDSAEKILSIINKMICITGVEQQKNIPKPYDLECIISNIKELGKVERRSGQSLVIDTEMKLESKIHIDWNLLEPALNELVENAFKFDTSGVINVKVINKIDAVRFEIANKGEIISEDESAVIFDIFTQVEDGLTRAHQGMGLGLATAATLTKLLEGSLVLEKSDQVETIFSLEIPAEIKLDGMVTKESSAVHNESSANSTTESVDDVNNLSCLVVEDNSVNQKILANMLERFGVETFVVENGEEGVNFFMKYRVDLVLMDIQMPVMDGCQATEKIRQFELENAMTPTKIIAVTANAHGDYFSEIRAFGFDDLVSKPIRLEQVKMLAKQIK